MRDWETLRRGPCFHCGKVHYDGRSMVVQGDRHWHSFKCHLATLKEEGAWDEVEVDCDNRKVSMDHTLYSERIWKILENYRRGLLTPVEAIQAIQDRAVDFFGSNRFCFDGDHQKEGR